MSQSEIENISEEDFKRVSPFDKRSCFDCAHLKSALSWWCTNPEAKKARGTSIPGCIKCHFWSPDWNMIDKKHKIPENGYVPTKAEIAVKKVKETSVSWYYKLINKIFNKG